MENVNRALGTGWTDMDGNSQFKAAIESVEEVLFSGWSRRRTAESGKEWMERKEAYSRWARELTVGQAESVRQNCVRERGLRRGARIGKAWRVDW